MGLTGILRRVAHSFTIRGRSLIHPMQDPDELTALELAETCGHEEIASLLKDGQ